MSTPTIRAQLAEALEIALPDGILVIDHPDEVSTIDPAHRAVVDVVRTEIVNTEYHGRHAHTFEVFLIEPTNTEDGESENNLDAITDEVIEALDEHAHLKWSKATRTVWNDRLPAYRFDLTFIDKTEEE